MADYTTVTKVENYTLQNIDPAFEPKVEEWVAAMSRFADSYCNRKLVADGSDSTRYFDGNGRHWLAIDDCQSITTVEVGDAWGDTMTATTSYVSYPRTAPHRALILKAGEFTPGVQNVAITADWGYMAASDTDYDQLSFAVTVLVGGIINSLNPNTQIKKSERVGDYSVSYYDDKGVADYESAMRILNNFRKLEI